jgi:phospholipid/cholesterol/gamma-HCH transport system substrate-binding protein
VFDDVMGLREGDNVMVRGFEVGKVNRQWLEPDGVHIRLSTDRPLNIQRDYSVEIVSASMLGGRFLRVYEGTAEAGPLAPDTKLRGTTPVDLIDQATATFDAIREALVEGGILNNLKASMEEFRSIVTTLNRDLTKGEGTVGKLLRDDEAYTKFIAVVDNFKEISDGMKQGEGTVGRLLKDDQLSRDMEATVANFREISDRISRGEGTLGKLLSEDDTLYLDLREAIAALKDLATNIQSGRGTLGKLATDDELYEEAKLLFQEIRAMVDDLRETAPITTFSSIFFGAF